MGRHNNAQKTAAKLETSELAFESIEARTVRALILVDAGQTEEARAELDIFFKTYETAKAGLGLPQTPPAFLTTDLKQDIRLQTLMTYQDNVKDEMEKMQGEDLRLFPVYTGLANELAPLANQARSVSAKIVESHIVQRLSDLDRLYVQAKLIQAETYLEDREKLRAEFTALSNVDVVKQKEHDLRLVFLLGQAVEQVDKATALSKNRNLNLDFRQAELLWELGTAHAILSQDETSEKEKQIAETLQLIASSRRGYFPASSRVQESRARFVFHGFC